MANEQKPRPQLDDWDGEPPPILPSISVEDTPTLVVLPNGRAWRRRIGFAPERRNG